MRQLVGCSCVICEGRIGSIVEGLFCADCGNPVHRACLGAPSDVGGKCRTCGGEIAKPSAAQVRWERQQKAPPGPRGSYPVSRVCPACSTSEFTPVRPDRWVAFIRVRACKSCGTRYTPPTPPWAAGVMVLAGLVLPALALVGGFFSLRAVDIVASVLMGFLGVLGALALGHGLRSLIRSGSV